MSLLRKTAAGASWSLVGTVALGIAATGTTIVAARVLSATELGEYALVSSIVALLAGAASFEAANYYVVQPERVPRLLRTGLTLETALGFTVWLLLSLGAAIFAISGGNTDVALLLVAAGTVLWLNPVGQLQAEFARALNYRVPNVGLTVVSLIAGAVKIVLVIVGLGAWGLVIGDVLISLLFGIYMLIRVPAGRGFLIDRDLMRGQLRYGVPSLASGILEQANSRAQEMVIAITLGTQQLGIFYVASRLPYQVFQVGTVLSRSLLASFSRATATQLRRGVELSMRFSAFFVGVPVAIAITLSKPVMDLLYGSKWTVGADAFSFLMAAIAVRFVMYHVLNLLRVHQRMRAVTGLSATQLALTITATLIGSAVDGLTGVTVAVLCVELTLAIPKMILLRSMVEIDVLRVLRWPLVATAAGCVVGLGASHALPDFAAVVISLSATSVLFAVVLWQTDAVVVKQLFRRQRTT